MSENSIRREGMRIGGETIHTDEVVEVRYPYTGEVIATVPAGTAEVLNLKMCFLRFLHVLAFSFIFVIFL